MKLVASMIVAEVEVDRYLVPCVSHLLGFCDEVLMLLDGDGQWATSLTGAWGDDGRRVVGVTARSDEEPVDFFAHEGRARQRLLDATLQRDPTHVLAIDADEFVSDGAAVRVACTDERYGAWSLCMEEVWNAGPEGLELRQDGGWEEHDVTVLWRPDRLRRPLRIADRALACGRVPEALRRIQTACVPSALLHFGWANQAEREARHDRYAVADGGRYHASAHLDSILLPDDQIDLTETPWPAALETRRDTILAHAGVRLPS